MTSAISSMYNPIASSKTINVLTYNIAWEAMLPKANKFGDLGKRCRQKIDECRNNVSQVIRDLNNYDFIAIQEIPLNLDLSTDYWNKQFNLNSSDHLIYYHMDGSEGMLTILDRNKYKYIDQCQGNIKESGRPFLVIIAKSKINKRTIAFINIHAGHGSTKNSSAVIQKEIESKCTKFGDIDRIIMAGDFNRDFNRDIKSNEIKLFGKNLINVNQGSSFKTCCSESNSIRHFRASDHILDSEENSTINTSSHRNVFPSSDHSYVIAELNRENIGVSKPTIIRSPTRVIRLPIQQSKPKTWDCSRCTYNNPVDKKKCEMCYTAKQGGKKVRKHQGINQSGGNKGRLKKGYRYSGKKLKSSLPQIIKVQKLKK